MCASSQIMFPQQSLAESHAPPWSWQQMATIRPDLKSQTGDFGVTGDRPQQSASLAHGLPSALQRHFPLCLPCFFLQRPEQHCVPL
jgi:hypothetical protein